MSNKNEREILEEIIIKKGETVYKELEERERRESTALTHIVNGTLIMDLESYLLCVGMIA
jgi:hypothetical protein